MPAPPTVTNSPTPPIAPADGDLWFNTTTGREYVWYVNPVSLIGVWVQTQPTSAVVPTPPSLPPPFIPPVPRPSDVSRVPLQTVSEVAPTSPAPTSGDLWWNTRSGQEFIYYNDGNTQQWVLANRGNGLTGDAGDDAFTRTTQPFNMPDIAANVIALVIDESFYHPGQYVFVEGAGYFSVFGVLPDQVGLTNIGAPGNVAPGTVVTSGVALLIAGPVGAGAPPYGPAGGVLSGTFPNPGFAPDPVFTPDVTIKTPLPSVGSSDGLHIVDPDGASWIDFYAWTGGASYGQSEIDGYSYIAPGSFGLGINAFTARGTPSAMAQVDDGDGLMYLAANGWNDDAGGYWASGPFIEFDVEGTPGTAAGAMPARAYLAMLGSTAWGPLGDNFAWDFHADGNSYFGIGGAIHVQPNGKVIVGGAPTDTRPGVITAKGDNGTAQGYATPHFDAVGIFPSYYMTSTVSDLTNVNDYGGAFYLNDPANNLIGYLGFGTTGTMPFAQFGVTGTFGGHGAFFNAFDDGTIVLQGLIARFGSDFFGGVPIPVEMGSLDALGFIRLRAAGYPKFWWNDTSGGVDAKKWQAYVMPDGGWRLGAINDAETAESGGINVHRDGTVNFATPSFGAIGTEGVTAAWVGHAIGSIVFPPPPTTLPPNGPAGGDLAGTYPNPTIGNGKVTPAKIAPSATNGQVLTTVAGAVAWAAAAGGTTISIGVAPPASPAAGALWWFSDGSAGGGQLYIFYDDGNSQQWVPAAAAAGPITPPLFSKSYVSPPQAVVAAGLISLPHGLGTKPLITTIRLRCLVAELGYAVGQEPEWFSGEGNTGGTSGRGCAIWSDGVNVNCRVASATTPLEIINATTGGFAVLTLANWAIILSAFA